MREPVTYALLWIIRRINRHKDRVLAKHLADMARDYEP